MKHLPTLPTELWIGNNVDAELEAYLAAHGRGHHQRVHLRTEKGYTLLDLDTIFERTSFTGDTQHVCFFIIHDAHLLNAPCVNRLLKLLEEPPAGYRFLLLTTNGDLIAPTIHSRALVRTFASSTAHTPKKHPFLQSFFELDPIACMQELKKAALSDHESTRLLHELYTTFAQVYKKEPENATHRTRLRIIEEAMRRPPQSGSSTLLWKNLYLALHGA